MFSPEWRHESPVSNGPRIFNPLLLTKHHRSRTMRSILLLTACRLSAAAQELTTSSLNSGGGPATGNDVEIAASLGGFGDISLSGGNGGAGSAGYITARAGFPGQIYDPVRIAITPGSATLTDNSQTQFSA